MRYKPFSRLLAVVAVLCLLCGSLTACGKARPIKSSKEELTPVGTVAGHEVLYEELRYLTLKYREAMAATYGETIWDSAESRELHRAELEAELEEAVAQFIKAGGSRKLAKKKIKLTPLLLDSTDPDDL